jgi:glycerol-3-phosphate acyltransferase PlsX
VKIHKVTLAQKTLAAGWLEHASLQAILNAMNNQLPIALDAMGGDHMPEAALAGAAQAAKRGIPLLLVGDETILKPKLAERKLEIAVHHAADVIGMDEHASDVRRRKDSSIMQACQLVKDGQASACVSMGHSGATMAAALLKLGRIKGIDRPAITANIPTAKGFVLLLDAGANADCRPRFLQQFALMGSLYCQAMYGIDSPSVGLMSIGEEDDKGNELSKGAFALLKETPNLNFYGNVEGRDLFKHTTDVMVTDGFTGNVMLKLAEGEARELFTWIRDALMSDWRSKLGAMLVKPALKSVASKLDPAEYGAQPLLGIDGNVFIGHGSADERAVLSALKTVQQAVDAGVLTHLKNELAKTLVAS